jgi:hypothetical protein
VPDISYNDNTVLQKEAPRTLTNSVGPQEAS